MEKQTKQRPHTHIYVYIWAQQVTTAGDGAPICPRPAPDLAVLAPPLAPLTPPNQRKSVPGKMLVRRSHVSTQNAAVWKKFNIYTHTHKFLSAFISQSVLHFTNYRLKIYQLKARTCF